MVSLSFQLCLVCQLLSALWGGGRQTRQRGGQGSQYLRTYTLPFSMQVSVVRACWLPGSSPCGLAVIVVNIVRTT